MVSRIPAPPFRASEFAAAAKPEVKPAKVLTRITVTTKAGTTYTKKGLVNADGFAEWKEDEHERDKGKFAKKDGAKPAKKDGGKFAKKDGDPGPDSAPPHVTGGPSPELRAVAETLVSKSGLSPKLAATYTADMAQALHKMPAGARTKALESVNRGDATFHPNLKELRKRFKKHSTKSAAGVLGFVVQPKGSDVTFVHLDGGGPGSTDPQYTAVGVYLHELAHAADMDSVHSSDPKWMSAWQREIKDGRHGVSKYALEDESEGFAELMRVVAQKGVEANRAKFPKCVAYLESKGLL